MNEVPRVVSGSRQGSKVLIYHGFKYQRNKTKLNCIHWRCWRKDCGTFLRTNRFDLDDDRANIVVEMEGAHMHDVDVNLIEVDRFKEKLRIEINANPTAPVKRVYDALAVREHRQAANGPIPTFESVKSTMDRKRARLVPPIPASVDEVVVEDVWAQTWREDDFLMDQDGLGVLCFATVVDLRKLATCNIVYVDGTFKSTPRPYRQIFTIHGMYLGHCVHFITCLLSGKTIPHYTYVLNSIKENILRITGVEWQPTEFVCDFEQAIISSIEDIFPFSEIDGCYFHFTKNLWKQVGELGLIVFYRNDEDLKTVIRKIMALGFLPLQFITGAFHILSTSVLVAQLMREYPNLIHFFEYVRDTYIVADSNFPPHKWNLWHRNMDTRTTNFVESFHHKLNSAIMVRHPSLWVFIRHMKDFHASSEMTQYNAEIGLPRPRRKRKWRRLEENLRRIKMQFIDGERNLHAYWSNVCYYVKDFIPRR